MGRWWRRRESFVEVSCGWFWVFSRASASSSGVFFLGFPCRLVVAHISRERRTGDLEANRSLFSELSALCGER